MGSLYFLSIWLFLFWRVPQHRKNMIFFGLLLAGPAMIGEYLWWTKDWWHPQTITGTRVGIEDFIASFTHLTIPSFIYKYTFGKTSDMIMIKKGIC